MRGTWIATETAWAASDLTRQVGAMPFYIRKSIKAGPFRFNLSKSGIGVSAAASRRPT
jgi:hypothetical protein